MGSLTSEREPRNTYKRIGNRALSINTVLAYLGYLENAFLIEHVSRYDVKDKLSIESTSKYDFTDIGIRNAILISRQHEENHIMDDSVYIKW